MGHLAGSPLQPMGPCELGQTQSDGNISETQRWCPHTGKPVFLMNIETLMSQRYS